MIFFRTWYILIPHGKLGLIAYFWVTKSKQAAFHDFDKSKYSTQWPPTLANLSPPWFWNFSQIFIRCSNRHSKTNKSTHRFFSNTFPLSNKARFYKSQWTKIRVQLINLALLYRKWVIVKYKHHIRNQHKKLSRVTYILLKSNFRQNSILYSPTTWSR